MNEDHNHTNSSLMNTSILSNKRSNFQFTYDSETNLLLLIHRYREDIFTRGNIIKTWDKVLQEFNEQHNANIVQSRTINHRFQILKKNLENRLKHENQPLTQISLNENEKLLIDIIDYMYKNNYSDINPYSLGGGVISANEHMDHVSSPILQHQPQHHLATTDLTQISPNTFTNKLNQERAQYLLSQNFDQSVHQFQSGIEMAQSLQLQPEQQPQPQPQPQRQPQPQPQPQPQAQPQTKLQRHPRSRLQLQQPQPQQHSIASASSNRLQQHPSSQNQLQQLNISKDLVLGFPPPLSQSDLIDDTNRIPTQAETLLQTRNHSSPQIMYKSDVNFSNATLHHDHIGVQSEPDLSSRHLSTPHSQPGHQIQRDGPMEHRSHQLSTSQVSPTTHYDPSSQQLQLQLQHHNHHHHHQQQQQQQQLPQSPINYRYLLQPHLP